ncbi:4'-phosphopantetheinyl transferase superfamily protein [Pedobacter sp. CG_S7]|uniref:4'-phosphopantetheinyl transferase family protein n=1 Tax=Pedobacter sp. CG_S7 TaxID=3143930 RepID=UPI0033963F05
MIGNDIVDLTVAAKESNWKRKGYLHKIFSKEEQLLILFSDKPDVVVWLLWSMKEAAYKIYSRKKEIRIFAPTQLCCKELNFSTPIYTGKVLIDGLTYFTESTFNDKMIHTICASSKEEINKIRIEISMPENPLKMNYRYKNPQCVSHHGAYLALVFINQDSLLSVN